MRKKTFMLLLLCAVMLGLLWWWQTTRNATLTIVAEQAKSLQFKVLLPKLSDKYTVNEKAISVSRDILLVPITAPNGAAVIISQQKKPDTFTFARAEGKKFRTLYGEALVQDFDDQTLGTLITTYGTVVLINAKPPIGSSEMENLINSLGPI